ncbi:hypothetical protein D3C80_1739560 [compost metagenome]
MTDYQAFVFEYMHMLIRSLLHLEERTIQVPAFVVLVVTGDVDHRTVKFRVCPRYPFATH